MAFWGLMSRREIWMPTRRGMVLLCGLILLTVFLVGRYAHDFLAINRPVDSAFYVVEGWLSKKTLKQVVARLKSDGYALVLTTGLPFSRHAYFAELYPQFATYAEVSAHVLKREGLDPSRVIAVSVSSTPRARTFHSVMALKDRLAIDAPHVRALNVITRGPHARRSRLLFQRGLGPDFQVGVIALPDPNYDAKRWWASSNGVKRLVTEALGYLYAKFFFFPNTP